jgi:hypothetical protein
MKHQLFKTLFVMLGLVGGSISAADVPALISYQGRLADADGTPLGASSPVNRKAFFSLFDDPDEGNRVWTEQQTITVSNGEFSVLLGNGTSVGTLSRQPLSKVFAIDGGNLYLEITVDTGNGNLSIANQTEDPPIKPRQRIVTTAFAFRSLSADGVTPGADLRFLASNNANNVDQGLGFYDSTRQFNGVSVNGPVLFGQGGGALGTADGSTRNIALSWLANGNVGIGTTSPSERLDVVGNIKGTGSLILGGGLTTAAGLTTTGAISAASLTSTGTITGGAITGTSLIIRPSASDPEVASISSAGVISITKGGTLNGPTGRPLNINSQGQITIKDLEVTESVTVPPSGATSVPPVLATQRRLVLGGALGWGDAVAATEAVPLGGANAATGMRLILTGTNAASDLVGFGLQPTGAPFVIMPPTGEMQWFGGLQQIMTLAGSSGTLTTQHVKATGTNVVARAHGNNSSRLLLTQTKATSEDTRDLVLTMRSDSTADLAWITDDETTLVPIMHFLFTGIDNQLSDQVPSRGYVGINVAKPRAPLHVKQVEDYQNNTDTNFYNVGTTSERLNFGVYLGPDGGVATFDGVSNVAGDGWTLRYENIAALFDGEMMTSRNWYGQALDASSDARAKHILGRSDTGEDLATLMKLQITDYHWIDLSRDGHRPHKRLIAQQVKEAFPQAVSTSPMPQAIPNVYELATKLEQDAAKSTLTITTEKPHEFAAGDVVDLIGDQKEMKETKVKAVLSPHQFVIDCTELPNSLFVYGKHVNDFHTVDYDAVSMLTVAATQELKQRRDALAAENTKLRAQLASEAKRLKALRQQQKADAAKFAALEALLENTETPAEMRPASLKTSQNQR